MTSEVLIMNEIGVALAADSAATAIPMNKTFKADKVFELSRTQPLGVMIYGNSSIDTIPIELIVSEYRRQIGDQQFETVGECAEDFLRFIETGGSESVESNPLITPDYIDYWIAASVLNLIRRFTKELSHELRSNCVPEESRTKYIDDTLQSLVKESGKGLNADDVRFMITSIKESLKRADIFNEVLRRFEFWNVRKFRNKILKIYANRILSDSGIEPGMGIVIAGYGSMEFMPSYKSYTIHGLYHHGLSYVLKSEARIDSNTRSCIETFAQDDVMRTYIDGIDPKLLRGIEKGLLKTVDEMIDLLSDYLPKETDMDMISEANGEIVREFIRGIHETMDQDYRYPVEDAVAFLSKDEMATLAESLIHSTSLRRHVSYDMESVGGPIDVAIISRNEGFIWIKRKHYFNTEFNLSYLERRRLT